jgi:hypothetical protein
MGKMPLERLPLGGSRAHLTVFADQPHRFIAPCYSKLPTLPAMSSTVSPRCLAPVASSVNARNWPCRQDRFVTRREDKE